MSRKTSGTKKKASAGKPSARATASQVSEHRRAHAAVHRFVGRLTREVEDAFDAARARRLGPIKRVLQNWRYLWRRYLDPTLATERPQTYPKPPAGWSEIEPDLALALALLDTREWTACFDNLKTVTAALEVYEGRPFNRKVPRFREDAGDDGETASTQVRESDSEDGLLAKLQQGARRIVLLFHELESSLAGRNVAAGPQSSEAPKPDALKPEMLRARELYVRDGLTQSEIAERLTAEFHVPCSQGKVSRWIRKVREHRGLPPLSRGFSAKSYDPAKLTMGERKDHRTPRQRKRLS